MRVRVRQAFNVRVLQCTLDTKNIAVPICDSYRCVLNAHGTKIKIYLQLKYSMHLFQWLTFLFVRFKKKL